MRATECESAGFERLTVMDHGLSPCRGLIPLRNAKGKPYDAVDLSRWVRVSRLVNKVRKVDILGHGCPFDSMRRLLDTAREMDLRISLRTDCAESPKNLDLLRNEGLFDVFLCPSPPCFPHVTEWLDACSCAGLSCRVQVPLSFVEAPLFDAFAEQAGPQGVTVLTIALWDPFVPPAPCTDPLDALRRMNAAVPCLEQRGIETNLLHVPFCLAVEENWPRVVNQPQYHRDHQHYAEASYTLALRLYERGPATATKALLLLMERQTSYWNEAIDRHLFPRLLSWPRTNLLFWMFHKVCHHMWPFRQTPCPLPDSPAACEEAIELARAEDEQSVSPPCRDCRMRAICDQASPQLASVLPGVEVKPLAGDCPRNPMQFSLQRPRYLDEIDSARCELDSVQKALAGEANALALATPPDREIDSFRYAIEGQWTHQMPGGVGWYSYTNTEKQSTVLARLELPCSVAVTFGGGMAEYIGFSIGRFGRVLCPMDATSHSLMLHADSAGRYVLLRDGKPVTPTEFEGGSYVPARLPDIIEPRICIRNIDGTIKTQGVMVWERKGAAAIAAPNVSYSVVIVCARFARRLQAALQCIAHQPGFDLSRIEVLVCYVPGIDAVDDVLDTCRAVYPGLRTVRMPFGEDRSRSKGFLINESVKAASGEWVILLDADTLVPPFLFAKLDEVAEGATFIAPDGRKMLDEQTTARVLLGEVRPWESWDALLEGPGEFRLREACGVPIGFFQCVRRSCFDKVKQAELDHFEGADWSFGSMIRNEFGHETRLSGVPVLHLDHGGSQWYGTRKHR